jgi:hypothetical protein
MTMMREVKYVLNVSTTQSFQMLVTAIGKTTTNKTGKKIESKFKLPDPRVLIYEVCLFYFAI